MPWDRPQSYELPYTDEEDGFAADGWVEASFWF